MSYPHILWVLLRLATLNNCLYCLDRRISTKGSPTPAYRPLDFREVSKNAILTKDILIITTTEPSTLSTSPTDTSPEPAWIPTTHNAVVLVVSRYSSEPVCFLYLSKSDILYIRHCRLWQMPFYDGYRWHMNGRLKRCWKKWVLQF